MVRVCLEVWRGRNQREKKGKEKGMVRLIMVFLSPVWMLGNKNTRGRKWRGNENKWLIINYLYELIQLTNYIVI